MGKFLGYLGFFAWSVHNLVGHPLSEIVHLVSGGKADKLSDWIHNTTIPIPMERCEKCGKVHHVHEGGAS